MEQFLRADFSPSLKRGLGYFTTRRKTLENGIDTLSRKI
jgi:hypothetical protein